MNPPFLMVSTSSIDVQSLGNIVQCTPAVGAKMWCLFFCNTTRPECCSLEGSQFKQALRCRLLADFNEVFSVFFRRDCSFRCTTWFSFCRHMVPQFSRNCRQKLRKVQKSAEKFVRTTSYRQLRDLKKIPLQLLRAENVDVHLYKTFSARRYLALTECRSSYRQSNNGSE